MLFSLFKFQFRFYNFNSKWKLQSFLANTEKLSFSKEALMNNDVRSVRRPINVKTTKLQGTTCISWEISKDHLYMGTFYS